MDLLLDMDPGCNGSTVCHGSTACNGSCHGSCHRSTACNGSTSGWFQAGFAQDTSLDCGTTRKDLPHPTPLSHLMSLSLMTSMTGQATLVRRRRTLSSSGSSHPTLHSTCESRNVRTSPVHRWGRVRPQTVPPSTCSVASWAPCGLGVLLTVPQPSLAPQTCPAPGKSVFSLLGRNGHFSADTAQLGQVWSWGWHCRQKDTLGALGGTNTALGRVPSTSGVSQG